MSEEQFHEYNEPRLEPKWQIKGDSLKMAYEQSHCKAETQASKSNWRDGLRKLKHIQRCQLKLHEEANKIQRKPLEWKEDTCGTNTFKENVFKKKNISVEWTVKTRQLQTSKKEWQVQQKQIREISSQKYRKKDHAKYNLCTMVSCAVETYFTMTSKKQAIVFF